MTPRIETPRLILRSHRLEDYASCAQMWGDPAVTRFIGGRVSTPQQTWSRVLAYRGHWALMGFGYWAIEEKASREFAGEAGFADFKREIAAMHGVPELGFALRPKFQGNGLCTEAVRAILAWGDDNLAATRTVCLIDEGNAASIGVVTKFGYTAFGRTGLGAGTSLLFERPRPGTGASTSA